MTAFHALVALLFLGAALDAGAPAEVLEAFYGQAEGAVEALEAEYGSEHEGVAYFRAELRGYGHRMSRAENAPRFEDIEHELIGTAWSKLPPLAPANDTHTRCRSSSFCGAFHVPLLMSRAILTSRAPSVR